MFETIRNYWRSALPGVGSVLGFSLWGWEQRFTNEPDAMIASIGFWVGVFFSGWLLGLIWADQSRPGSTLRRVITRRKRIEPVLSLKRANMLFDPPHGDGQAGISGLLPKRERDMVYVFTYVAANRFRDFSNVEADYTISLNGQAVSVGKIYTGDLNRGDSQGHCPITLICDRADSDVYYLDNDKDPMPENLVKIPRGHRLQIIIGVSARGQQPVHREFYVDVRNDPFGRIYVRCPDGQQYFSLSF